MWAYLHETPTHTQIRSLTCSHCVLFHMPSRHVHEAEDRCFVVWVFVSFAIMMFKQPEKHTHTYIYINIQTDTELLSCARQCTRKKKSRPRSPSLSLSLLLYYSSRLTLISFSNPPRFPASPKSRLSSRADAPSSTPPYTRSPLYLSSFSYY